VFFRFAFPSGPRVHGVFSSFLCLSRCCARDWERRRSTLQTRPPCVFLTRLERFITSFKALHGRRLTPHFLRVFSSSPHDEGLRHGRGPFLGPPLLRTADFGDSSARRAPRRPNDTNGFLEGTSVPSSCVAPRTYLTPARNAGLLRGGFLLPRGFLAPPEGPLRACTATFFSFFPSRTTLVCENQLRFCHHLLRSVFRSSLLSFVSIYAKTFPFF